MNSRLNISTALRYSVAMLICLLFALCGSLPAYARNGEADKPMGSNYFEALTQKKDKLNPFAMDFQGSAALPMSPAGTLAKGVDISYHNGDIDFAKLKKEVDFVIIRCGYGENELEQDDVKFEEYVNACKEYEIPYGVYLYSYADSEQRALSEADHAIRLLGKCEAIGYRPTLPVFLDMEDDTTIYTDARMKGEIARIFCSMLQSASYKTGIYANKSWWETYLTDPFFDHVIKWVAQYNTTCEYDGFYDIWQCSESARIDAISTKVDYNYMVTDLFHDTMENYTMNQCDIEEIANQNYTGERLRPSVKVSYHGTMLQPSIDYTLVYGENTSVGSGSVTIRGIGRFSGTVTKTFTISPESVTLLDVQADGSSGAIKWRKTEGASGYQVALLKKGETKWKYYLTKQTMLNVDGLDRGEWVVKVRAFVTIEGVKYLGVYGNKKTLVIRSNKAS